MSDHKSMSNICMKITFFFLSFIKKNTIFKENLELTYEPVAKLLKYP